MVGVELGDHVAAARGSTGRIAPITLQYSGAAGITAISGGVGANGGLGSIASGDAGTSAADSMRAPMLGSAIAEAGIAWTMRAQCSAAVRKGPGGCDAQAASRRVAVAARVVFMGLVLGAYGRY